MCVRAGVCVWWREEGGKKETGCTNITRSALSLGQLPVSSLMAQISALNIDGGPAAAPGHFILSPCSSLHTFTSLNQNSQSQTEPTRNRRERRGEKESFWHHSPNHTGIRKNILYSCVTLPQFNKHLNIQSGKTMGANFQFATNQNRHSETRLEFTVPLHHCPFLLLLSFSERQLPSPVQSPKRRIQERKVTSNQSNLTAFKVNFSFQRSSPATNSLKRLFWWHILYPFSPECYFLLFHSFNGNSQGL